nr:undecaprenyl/decaprenyl-phosphate alpha-N-acetylglucosaminyl 1-phosphate transferase [Chloroflexota bacterium]
MIFLLIFTIAFVLSLLLTPIAARIGNHWNIVDVPGGRRKHAGIIPRTGGVALYIAFVAAMLLAAVLGPRLPAPEGHDPKEFTRLVGILLGSTFLFAVGIYDDRIELKPLYQFVAQLIAALIAVFTLVFIERVMNPFTNKLVIFPWYVTTPITILWIVGMINTFNFLDGLDGLAASVAAIVAMVLFIHMYRVGQYSVSLLPLALLGCTLGFLPYNFYPAKVFMGSMGSFFLGYAVATLSIVAGARMATVLLVLAVPILDVGWLIWLRMRRSGTFVHGDRRHLHFRLVDLGLSQRQVVLAYCLLSATFGVLALSISSRLFKLIALLVLGLMTVLVLAIVTWLSERRTNPH